MSETHEERIAREEETWTGPKFMGLLVVTLVVALSVIYTMASLGHSQADQNAPADFSWNPFGKTPEDGDMKPSSVSGLVR